MANGMRSGPVFQYPARDWSRKRALRTSRTQVLSSIARLVGTKLGDRAFCQFALVFAGSVQRTPLLASTASDLWGPSFLDAARGHA